jgi:hypothetical protein
LTQKETEVQLLAAQVSDAEEKLKETEASWETKSEDIITQHLQQYQHLSNQYQDVLLKTQSFENKLQECGVNPGSFLRSLNLICCTNWFRYCYCSQLRGIQSIG